MYQESTGTSDKRKATKFLADDLRKFLPELLLDLTSNEFGLQSVPRTSCEIIESTGKHRSTMRKPYGGCILSPSLVR